jgi:hypothetical protein
MRCTYRRSSLLLAGFAILFIACTDPTEPVRPLSPDLRLAKPAATADPTVTSTLPSEAPQGTTLDVQINGSGFDRGSFAHFERDGTVDPRVQVNSTRFLKSTQLVANLTIAPDAVVSPYDVVVITTAGKKGIGTEMFAVQLSNELPTWTIDATQSVNFASDGRGDYVSGQCGVEGQIFYGNYNPATGVGGDATFENINPRKSACGPRSVKVTINGVAHNVPAWNVMRVVGLSEGATREQNFGMAVDGVTNCARLAWWKVEDGGAGGQITVTRTSSKTWTAVTSGNARCVYFKGQTRLWGAVFSDVKVGFVITEQN